MQETRIDTPWEQGLLLSVSSAEKLGLLHPETREDTVAILVSHDCDVLESAANEPFCEILIGRKIEAINGLYANGKSPRRLHLNFSAGPTALLAEFFATEKRSIKKELLLAESPLPEIRLTQDEHFTLQSWLAARYHRAIFPDEFDRRLKERPAEVHKKIASTIKATGTDLIAVLFDIDSGKDEKHGEADDPYALTIILVYNVSEDPGRAQASANKAASTIKSLFRQYYYSDKKWKNIELRVCLPVSADSISLHQLRSTRPWNFDYLDIVESG
ncbi:hypothetical protein KMZ29_10950 [Bradyrhizobium sediminis]|uniref:Uncharacterized protein n=1 Tax=Bradyrhizobium sediminis TaxID=2840469 RepID=A0A975NIF7_9BRAD|nr:hypothetical protein [Bradyrhizobium sediminis]QWG15126.1 hypothetical protein KMZ29_10950 [Bradyrhizobium sediminis]